MPPSRRLNRKLEGFFKPYSGGERPESTAKWDKVGYPLFMAGIASFCPKAEAPRGHQKLLQHVAWTKCAQIEQKRKLFGQLAVAVGTNCCLLLCFRALQRRPTLRAS